LNKVINSISTHTSIAQLQREAKWASFAFLGLLFISLNSCQQNEKTLFKHLNPTHTGIDFKNQITEDSVHNVLNFTNFYTGSGVGIGDFDKDGLPDIFFGGNMESSRLYLNKGALQFEDATSSAGVATDRWITGVAVVDINTDGWDDVYLSVSGKAEEAQRKNLLFVNQQDGTFVEQAAQYGLADASQSTHAGFFDYDRDGDLDMFLIVNPTDYKLYNVNSVKKKKLNGEANSTDKLFRNNGDGTFTDVSREAGILIEGYSLSMNLSDLNNDNWPDIYVTNDFLTNDILYINNQDGTFTDQSTTMLKHTSFASMGVDVADLNNDLHPEIYVLDMFPEDNYRQKMIMGSGNYDRFEYIIKNGYQAQYSRNTLQVNNRNGSYTEIGQMANVHKTDWSWSALMADYDNDGWKDIFVTNGFGRDLGDLDYINTGNANAFGDPASRKQAHLERILNQPAAQIPNYIFKNEGSMNFSKQSEAWGIAEPSCSHGAAFADLDNDGDLDLVVNNVSQTAFIYENQTNQLTNNNYLKIKLSSKETTSAKVYLYVGDQMQYQEIMPYRGYQSSVESTVHFGLGEINKVDRIEVEWNDDRVTRLENISANQTLEISDKERDIPIKEETFTQRAFAEQFGENVLFNYVHQEDLQVDFNSQGLLPHQHSKQGPCVAVADVNGDGLEDVFIGGVAGEAGQFFIQKSDATFTQQALNFDKEKEDTDVLFFDYDGDADLDLYVTSGGVIYGHSDSIYQDRLYVNEGGVFTRKASALPAITSSTSTVIANDFDEDGDQDLFVGGRVSPTNYPLAPRSYLLINEQGIYKDATPAYLQNIGMVSDALWTDYDSDGDVDLMLAGEFMPLTFIENKAGRLANQATTIPQSKGWWNALAQADFDGDADMDYLAGNLGLNSDLKASAAAPVRLYANDFDKNGKIDPVLCHYVNGEEFPVVSRDKLVKQIPAIKTRFNDYKSYAKASFADLFKSPEKANMLTLEAQTFKHSYIENKGNGQFELSPLDRQCQVSPIQDFWLEDLNKEGYVDVLSVGNDYATEVVIGRYDAGAGFVLESNGKGSFKVKDAYFTGLNADKDARTIDKIKLANGKTMYLVGNNSANMQVFITTENEVNKMAMDKKYMN